MRKQQTCFTVSDEQLQLLQNIADENDRSVSSLINYLVRLWLREMNKSKDEFGAS